MKLDITMSIKNALKFCEDKLSKLSEQEKEVCNKYSKYSSIRIIVVVLAFLFFGSFLSKYDKSLFANVVFCTSLIVLSLSVWVCTENAKEQEITAIIIGMDKKKFNNMLDLLEIIKNYDLVSFSESSVIYKTDDGELKNHEHRLDVSYSVVGENPIVDVENCRLILGAVDDCE